MENKQPLWEGWRVDLQKCRLFSGFFHEQVKTAHFAIAPSARPMPAGECAVDVGFILSASVMD